MFIENIYSELTDSYVTTSVSGTMFEDYSYGYYAPTAFTAELELRTAWYFPNVVKDISHDPNEWNKAV